MSFFVNPTINWEANYPASQFTAGFKTAIFCGFLLLIVLLAGSCWGDYSEKPDDWYHSDEARRIADNILSWQSPLGSWPKNVNTKRKPYSGEPNELEGTFDNGATTGELRFLARAFCATGDKRYERAFLKGLDHILKAQYPSGGWPQSYPPGKGYPRHITFNDGAMIRLMYLLREVVELSNYDFVDVKRLKAAKVSFDRGIECILKCQIRNNNQLTVWCAQHDEVDYRPRPGRTYELVSLSGYESADILQLLMSLDNPSPEAIDAIEAGAGWFASASPLGGKLNGIRQIRMFNGDRFIIKDPNAPPLWARFYEIGSNRPIFSGRDGVKKYNLDEIEAERRREYRWYGDWGVHVAKTYAEWKKKWLVQKNKNLQ
jgi:PelA/Pel-15E family pectate lyase